MKPKEFRCGRMQVIYKNKNWSSSKISAGLFSLTVILLFELYSMITVSREILYESSVGITVIVALIILCMATVLFTVTISMNLIYGKNEKSIVYLDWLKSLDDIQIQDINGCVYILARRGREYKTYSLQTFLQPYTKIYKVKRCYSRHHGYIELNLDFENPCNTIVTIY